MISFLEEPDGRLDAYLDDLLEGTERAEFEREIRDDPELGEEVALQRRIDGALRRVMELPGDDERLVPSAVRALLDDEHEDEAPPRPAGRILRVPWVRRIAVAAAIVGVVLGAWLIVQALQAPAGRYQPPPRKSMLAIYEAQVAEGFDASWVCENDEQFRNAFLGQYGQPLSLDETPEGVAALGLSYANTISERTMMLLARVDEAPVIVFIDRLDRDTAPRLPRDSDLHLHLHRAVVGRLVLYELSPLEEPRLLGLFHEPDVDRNGEGVPDR